jgi:hypothetical protein
VYSFAVVVDECLRRGAPPSAYDDVIQRALGYAPESRPASAGELMRLVDDALRPKSAAPVAVTPPTPTPTHHARRRLAKAMPWAATAVVGVGMWIARPGAGDEDGGRAPATVPLKSKLPSSANRLVCDIYELSGTVVVECSRP